MQVMVRVKVSVRVRVTVMVRDCHKEQEPGRPTSLLEDIAGFKTVFFLFLLPAFLLSHTPTEWLHLPCFSTLTVFNHSYKDLLIK